MHEAFEDRHKIYFIIDELRGETLFDKIIQEGQLNDINAACIAAYLVSILRYMHRQNIIIRNFKPENILFEEKESNNLKLVDLTLAIDPKFIKHHQPDHIFDHFTKMRPIFISPELLKKKKSYSFSTDVWTLGCVIFNMITGIPPFYETNIEIMQEKLKQKSEYPSLNQFENTDLRNLLSKLLIYSPQQRCELDDLIQDPWINSAHQRYRTLPPQVIKTAFFHIQHFKLDYQLQRAALLHMTKIMINKREKEHLRMIFDALDEEKDGEIELHELKDQMIDKFQM